MNEIEAKAIVEALIDHVRNPDKWVGIVTFSTAQRDRDHVDEKEAFVKNLENVQGDERDHILVSVGYGPRAPGGRLDSMNGPVSTDGGQRRLNVLFTRACHRCEVFCSFDPADINAARTTREGAKVLKRYLTFAEKRLLDEPAPTGEDSDSPFEEVVAREIKSLGFLTDPQVGTAGFKIDLGVRDPERPGCYILAVECDGTAYHGSLWARERDRLRSGDPGEPRLAFPSHLEHRLVLPAI